MNPRLVSFLFAVVSISLIIYFIIQNREHFVYNYKKYHYFTYKFENVPSKEHISTISKQHNFVYLGQVGKLKNYRMFRKSKNDIEDVPQFLDSLKTANLEYKPSLFKRLLKKESSIIQVADVSLSKPRKLHKKAFLRDLIDPELYNLTRYKKLGIKDPGFTRQWHLKNLNTFKNDLNVTGLWEEGINGEGAIVAIIDDGVDYTHKDIQDNFYYKGSYDFNVKRKLPMPELNEDVHGTRCAGQIAAKPNDVCGVGIAYKAKVSGIRILSLEISAEDEAVAINYDYHNNHIFSCSWGPPDDGKAMDAAPDIVRDAIYKGITEGRSKLGTVFVFASGNGGMYDDNCNFDGYTNSVYSITIGAISEFDQHPEYSEACTALMAVTYSNGVMDRSIYTSSSWRNQCTDQHGGTSAAAPMGAGVVALALSVRPDLHWRDFQHITINSAIPINLEDGSWGKLASGKLYSTRFGFGKIDAYKFVKYAIGFKSVGPQSTYSSTFVKVHKIFGKSEDRISSSFTVTENELFQIKFFKLEHITVTVNIEHQKRNEVRISLLSPNNITSELGTPRRLDHSSAGFQNWTFSSVKHFGESPIGVWTLLVEDIINNENSGRFLDWQLKLWCESRKPSVPKRPTKNIISPSKFNITEWNHYKNNIVFPYWAINIASYFMLIASIVLLVINIFIYIRRSEIKESNEKEMDNKNVEYAIVDSENESAKNSINIPSDDNELLSENLFENVSETSENNLANQNKQNL